MLREKWDKFGEISSLSGKSSLICCQQTYPFQDALLFHPHSPPPFSSVSAFHTKEPGWRSMASSLVSVPLTTSARQKRTELGGQRRQCLLLWEEEPLGTGQTPSPGPTPRNLPHADTACLLSKRQGDKVNGTLYKWHPDPPPFQPCPRDSLWKP